MYVNRCFTLCGKSQNQPSFSNLFAFTFCPHLLLLKEKSEDKKKFLSCLCRKIYADEFIKQDDYKQSKNNYFYLISKLDGIESKTQWRQRKKKKVQTFSPDHEFWWRIGQTNRSVYAAASTVELYS